MELHVEAQHTEVEPTLRDWIHTRCEAMSIKEHETTQVECPHCHGTQVEQLLSTFIAKTAKKS